jgi:hypothetical protein
MIAGRAPRSRSLSTRHGLSLSTNLPRRIASLMGLVPHRRYPSRAEGLASQVQVRSSQNHCCVGGQDQQTKVDHGGSREIRRYIDRGSSAGFNDNCVLLDPQSDFSLLQNFRSLRRDTSSSRTSSNMRTGEHRTPSSLSTGLQPARLACSPYTQVLS